MSRSSAWGDRDLDDDEVLLDVLGGALRAEDPAGPDAVPEDALALARTAWNGIDFDVELAALLLDTLTGEAMATMREDPAEIAEQRALVFEGTSGRISIELSTPEHELLGQLEPAEQAEVELHCTEGVRSTWADDLGRFRFALPGGPLRLRVRRSTGRDLLTPWLTR